VTVHVHLPAVDGHVELRRDSVLDHLRRDRAVETTLFADLGLDTNNLALERGGDALSVGSDARSRAHARCAMRLLELLEVSAAASMAILRGNR